MTLTHPITPIMLVIFTISTMTVGAHAYRIRNQIKALLRIASERVDTLTRISVQFANTVGAISENTDASDNEVHVMGTPNLKGNKLRRLENKTLDAQFLQMVQEGMNCSPFESNAILDIVKEVFFPFVDEATVKMPPGKITLMAVAADEPAGKPIAQCEKVAVCLTIHRGPEDDQILEQRGPTAFRRSRIPELCQQALSQGALLTREDLASHVFFVSSRTISRDLSFLRKEHSLIPVPLRSIIQDIGPVLTHRVEIVRLALKGKTTSEIRDLTNHSPSAISNYISTFARCAQLAEKKMQVGQIAFLLRRSDSLTKSYLELLKECKDDENMAYHLNNILHLGRAIGEKKSTRRTTNGTQS